jgi:serine/threonine-protein kinase
MVAPTDPDARIGSVLDGRYRILERLAEGGMGIVYRAERVPVGRPVAIKFLHKVYADDRESRARFERETRVLSKLAHPHCVSVIDFGVDGGPYLVMDFVGGTTLRSMLDEGPLPPPQAIALARQILAGLAHAHEQGIIHRDIKPANIMVSDEIGTGRHVRILDFGLARLRGTAATSVTISTIVVGTPSYMAPEQTVGGELSARTDLYAVGVVLFEMLTGDRPFIADETPELLELHRSAPVPKLAERAPGVTIPRGLDAVLERAMAKDPAERWSSAVAFSDALDNVARRNALPMPRLASQPVYQIVNGDGATAEIDDADVVDEASRADVVARPSKQTRAARESSGRGLGNFIIWALLLAGAVGAYVLISKAAQDATSKRGSATGTRTDTGIRGGSGSSTTGSSGSAKATATDPPPVAADAAVAVATAAADAAPAAVLPDAEVAVAVATIDAAPAVIAEPDAGEPAIEITTDEEAPEADPAAEDVAQAPDEPDPGGTDTEPAPPPDVTAPPTPTGVAPPKTIDGALALLKKGGKENRDAAIAGLRAQWRKNPRSSRLPFILGNIFFEMRWWSIAMQHYRAAIKRGPAYRRNSILIRNVIRALASTKTRGKATWFLRNVIGKAARPHLRNAARYHPHPAVKAAARRIRI